MLSYKDVSALVHLFIENKFEEELLDYNITIADIPPQVTSAMLFFRIDIKKGKEWWAKVFCVSQRRLFDGITPAIKYLMAVADKATQETKDVVKLPSFEPSATWPLPDAEEWSKL